MAIGAADRRSLTALYGVLFLANMLAWAAAAVAFRGSALLLGIALLAWGLGLRHAVDADHIAAIDNVTRKLMQEGKRPYAAGFFFALGHSTLVIVAAMAVAVAAGALKNHFPDLLAVGGVISAMISAGFLLVIAIINLSVLSGICRLLWRVRSGGGYAEEELDLFLARRGFLGRLYRRLFRLISQSWHMYPLGVLFALGFDTASEIAVLGISASQSAQGLSVWAVMLFPLLFTAGMALVDTTDGVLMFGAYGWAFINPRGKLYYNFAVTGLSVVVALGIGGVEALGLAAQKLDLKGRGWNAISAAAGHLGLLGAIIVGLFAVLWFAAFLIYRLRGGAKLPSAG